MGIVSLLFVPASCLYITRLFPKRPSREQTRMRTVARSGYFCDQSSMLIPAVKSCDVHGTRTAN
jgi:hypothetical protein